MACPRQLATVLTGATSIVLIQWLPLLSNPLIYISKNLSHNLGLTSAASAEVLLSADPGFDPDVPDAPRRTIGTGSRLHYTPPTDLGSPSRGTGDSGTRGGCNATLPGSLTLLAPVNHTGATVSGHPTFYWYLSGNQSAPMKFTLVEVGVPEPLVEQKIEQAKAGINQLEMPKDGPELVPGKEYRWTVSLICNPTRPSQNIRAFAMIKRVPTTPALEKKLADAQSNFARAQVYAESTLWYDVLAAISAARAANPNDQQLVNDFLSLLDTVGLNRVTKQERQRLPRQQQLGVQR